MTCNECSHKVNNTCPWRYLYEDTDYAEDCMDFINTNEEKEENNNSEDQ